MTNYKDLNQREKSLFNQTDSILLRTDNTERINILTALLDKYLSLELERVKGGLKTNGI